MYGIFMLLYEKFDFVIVGRPTPIMKHVFNRFTMRETHKCFSELKLSPGRNMTEYVLRSTLQFIYNFALWFIYINVDIKIMIFVIIGHKSAISQQIWCAK